MEERIIEIIESLTDFKDLRKNREIDLLENEILDSLAFIELIEALEEEFDIEIQPTQVSPDTWRNVKKIAEMVEKRRWKTSFSFLTITQNNIFNTVAYLLATVDCVF